MHIPSRLFSIVAILAVASASALGAPSIDEQYAAAARMHTWLFAAEGLQKKCAGRFPEIQRAIAKDLVSWKRQDQVAIKRANGLWEEMEASSPRSPEEVQDDADHLEAIWSQLVQSDSPREKCLSYFASHAKGVLRVQWPEVFEVLEAQ
jgi:hypothetical protein